MADNVNFVNPDQENTEQVNAPSSNPELDYLKSIDKTLQDLIKTVKSVSQSDARDATPRRDDFRRNKDRNSPINQGRDAYKAATDQFMSAFQKGMLEGVLGSSFKDDIKKTLNDMAAQVGMELEDIPSAVGQELGKQITDALKDTKLGKSLNDRINKFKDEALGGVKDNFTKGVNDYFSKRGMSPDQGRAATRAASQVKSNPAASAADAAKDVASGVVSDAASSVVSSVVGGASASGATTAAVSALGTGASGAGAMLSGVASAAGPLLSLLPQAAAALAALSIGSALLDTVFGDLADSAGEFFNSLWNSFNRASTSRQKRIEEANKRIAADIESIVREPFEILKDAAQTVYEAWDANLRVINQTQGYTKSDLQDLMGAYATRLREDNLSSVVSATDITESLAKVLDAGLSGSAAEEFAYIATVLNAAIPTQDFFGYADTYASIAANAMKGGMSQSAAIEYANEQLELFASDVLYASRELSGGFTTGLKDAGSLFEDAVKIAQTSRTGNPSEIAGVLTAVSAATGAIAPDLASALTDAVVQAATGGNNSQLVAMRAMAGINASNTDFLRQLAEDPQGVFTEMFRGLAEMQNMSNDAYMEVAEGLSDIFGLSTDVFARVDFNYLADAISNMDTTNASLAENLQLLMSGESTTSAEAQRMQQINEYLIDEGLSYVMDNEVARAIQQHMWDEQIVRELQETTYAVELQGSALQFLEGIRSTIENILNFLMPWRLIGKAINSIGSTAVQMAAMTEDVKQVLELGKVGDGNPQDLYNLTSYGKKLDLTPDLLEIMGGKSAFNTVQGIFEFGDALINGLSGPFGIATVITDALANGLNTNRLTQSSASMPTSKYSWGTVSKSTASLVGSLQASGETATLVSSVSTVADAAETAVANLDQRLQKYLQGDYIASMVDENKDYDDWYKEVSKAVDVSAAGYDSLEDALTELGYTPEAIKNAFQTAETQQGAEKQLARMAKEEDFWEVLKTNTTNLVDLVTHTNEFLNGIYKVEQEFLDEWVDYFVNHTAYNEAFTTRDEVTKIQNQEKSGTEDAIYALAEALQSNSIDLLRDPTLQTNALLGQILIVVNAIMQQNNTTSGGLSLPDTLQGLSMGLVSSE